MSMMCKGVRRENSFDRRNISGNRYLAIENGYLNKCIGRNKEITIPNSVIAIGCSAFAYKFSLRKVVIPNSVKYINSWAFFECVNLENINIPDSVKIIDSYAFYLTKIREFFIPDSVEEIGLASLTSLNLEKISVPDTVKIGKYTVGEEDKVELIIRAKNGFEFNAGKNKKNYLKWEQKRFFLNAIIEFIKNNDGADEKIHSENAKYLSNRFDYYSDIATNQEKAIMLEYIDKFLKVDRFEMVEKMFCLD